MRDPVILQVGLSVNKGSNSVVNSLAIVSNCFWEQLATAVTKRKASLDLVHCTYSREEAAGEHSTTGVSMHLNSTFL